MAMVRPYPNFPAFRMKLGVMPDFSGAKFSYNEVPAGEISGTNRMFTLLNQPLPDSLQVFKDGMYMQKGQDYNLDRINRTLTFSVNQIPQEKSTISVSYKHY